MSLPRHGGIWSSRYTHVCPPDKGKIVHMVGIGRQDTYNVAMYEQGTEKIIAFRTERRSSFAWRPARYHPVVHFARQQQGQWVVDPLLQPFDMMEDPFFFTARTKGRTELIFGGVVIRREGHRVIPQTLFFRGSSVETLDRTPFAVIDNMKDTRLLQLPDGRFLLMRRPWGGSYGRGRITLHLIESLEHLATIKADLPTLAILDSCGKQTDWVGINEAHLLESKGETYVGLLGHVAFQNISGKHYAACTYTIKLPDILNGHVETWCPHIIVTRPCFAVGPAKMKGLRDVVFPGHLEHLRGDRYRLWAGLNDTRIGSIEIENPFQLN